MSNIEIERNNIQLDVGDDDLDEGDLVDAQGTLAKALVVAAAPVREETVMAAAFLQLYIGKAAAAPFIRMAFKYKGQQSGNMVGPIVKGMEAMAIVNKSKYLEMMGGGKK